MEVLPGHELHGGHSKQRVEFPSVYQETRFSQYLRIREALFAEMWYSFCALNTAAVLCGPSGLYSDLRIPALRFLRSFSA